MTARLARLRSRALARRRREPAAAPSRLQDFVVITGFSGAGKSQAMTCFEDAGYFCVDNLPPEMIGPLADLFSLAGSRVERAAVVCDVRSGAYFEGLVRALDELEERGMRYRLLFLEASEEVLVNRYKETRRPHPLASGGRVTPGIQEERRLLEPLEQRATLALDTSELSASRLRKLVAEKMLRGGETSDLAVTFLSFGYKHGGVPREADLAFDVRFLPNPHYEPELRELTGRDESVIAYVRDADGMREFHEHLTALLDYLLPAYAAEGKSQLTIALGCTGGRHRSVVIAEDLAQRYGSRPGLSADAVHRDVTRPPLPV